MLASGRNGTLYVGVTIDLIRRVYEHKSKFVPSFTSKYKIDQLVWFEHCDSMESAIIKEKQIKGWRRDWKIKNIEATNSYWHDLYLSLV